MGENGGWGKDQYFSGKGTANSLKKCSFFTW